MYLGSFPYDNAVRVCVQHRTMAEFAELEQLCAMTKDLNHPNVLLCSISRPGTWCTVMAAAFEYLVRFVDEEGTIVYGNVSEEIPAENLVGASISSLSGDPFTGLNPTKEQKVVVKVSQSFRIKQSG